MTRSDHARIEVLPPGPEARTRTWSAPARSRIERGSGRSGSPIACGPGRARRRGARARARPASAAPRVAVQLEPDADRAVFGAEPELRRRAGAAGALDPRVSSSRARRARAPAAPSTSAKGEDSGDGEAERERHATMAGIVARPVCAAMGLWSRSRRGSVPLTLSRRAVPLGPQRRLGAVGDAELAEDPREVRLDGLLADLEPARDQLVRQPLDEQRRAPRARGRRAPRAGRAADACVEDRAGGARVERGLAARRGADALGDRPRRRRP